VKQEKYNVRASVNTTKQDVLIKGTLLVYTIISVITRTVTQLIN
jgi:hypothetical protein